MAASSMGAPGVRVSGPSMIIATQPTSEYTDYVRAVLGVDDEYCDAYFD